MYPILLAPHEPDSEGNFWVSGFRRIYKGDKRRKRFPGIQPPIGEDLILKVDGNGKILEEISLLESIYMSPYRHLLWVNGRAAKGGDQMHLNDVRDRVTR